MGEFRLLVGDDLVHLPVQCQRVLALLAVRGSPQNRSTVAGTLWQDVAEDRAKANLRNAVWRIQSASASVLRCTRTALELDATVPLDLTEAQRRAQQLVYGPDDLLLPGAIQVLERDLLPDWDEDWLSADRERQRQLRMHALEVLSAALCRGGRYPEAVSAALAAVSAEPLRESSQRALICAHLSEGNLSEAVRQLTSYRRLLDTELGVVPSAPLEAVVGAALAAARPMRNRSLAASSRV